MGKTFFLNLRRCRIVGYAEERPTNVTATLWANGGTEIPLSAAILV